MTSTPRTKILRTVISKENLENLELALKISHEKHVRDDKYSEDKNTKDCHFEGKS